MAHPNTSHPINLAFLIDSFEQGGTELNAFRTAQSLATLGVRPQIFHLQPDGPLRALYLAEGFTLQHVPARSFRYPSTYRAALELGRQLVAEGCAVLHCHDIYSNVFGMVAAARAKGTRLLTSRRWGAVSPNRPLALLNRLAYHRSDLVIANSSAIADLVVSTEGIKRKIVRVIPNFLEPAAFVRPDPGARAAWRIEVGLPADAVVIGSVARLVPVKDHITMLRGFAQVIRRFPDSHLALVGDGPERDRVRDHLGVLCLPSAQVHLLGHLPNRPNPHGLFDISVQTSTSEGFPNSIIEAMAAGRAVVATGVGGTRDAVIDGITGIVIPPSDPDRLADALTSLLETPSLREAYGAKGEARARTVFREDIVIPSLAQVYETIARSR